MFMSLRRRFPKVKPCHLPSDIGEFIDYGILCDRSTLVVDYVIFMSKVNKKYMLIVGNRYHSAVATGGKYVKPSSSDYYLEHNDLSLMLRNGSILAAEVLKIYGFTIIPMDRQESRDAYTLGYIADVVPSDVRLSRGKYLAVVDRDSNYRVYVCGDDTILGLYIVRGQVVQSTIYSHEMRPMRMDMVDHCVKVDVTKVLQELEIPYFEPAIAHIFGRTWADLAMRLLK